MEFIDENGRCPRLVAVDAVHSLEAIPFSCVWEGSKGLYGDNLAIIPIHGSGGE
jgi:hypothetical protein